MSFEEENEIENSDLRLLYHVDTLLLGDVGLMF